MIRAIAAYPASADRTRIRGHTVHGRLSHPGGRRDGELESMNNPRREQQNRAFILPVEAVQLDPNLGWMSRRSPHLDYSTEAVWLEAPFDPHSVASSEGWHLLTPGNYAEDLFQLCPYQPIHPASDSIQRRLVSPRPSDGGQRATTAQGCKVVGISVSDSVPEIRELA